MTYHKKLLLSHSDDGALYEVLGCMMDLSWRKDKAVNSENGKVELKGMQFQREEAKAVCREMAVGDSCILMREPWNAYDENSIAVWYKGYIVGYVDRDTAEKFHGVVENTYPICSLVKYVSGNEDVSKMVVNIEVFYEDSIGTSKLDLANTHISIQVIEPGEELVEQGTFDFDKMVLNERVSLYRSFEGVC